MACSRPASGSGRWSPARGRRPRQPPESSHLRSDRSATKACVAGTRVRQYRIASTPRQTDASSWHHRHGPRRRRRRHGDRATTADAATLGRAGGRLRPRRRDPVATVGSCPRSRDRSVQENCRPETLPDGESSDRPALQRKRPSLSRWRGETTRRCRRAQSCADTEFGCGPNRQRSVSGSRRNRARSMRQEMAAPR
jgi:hypothetical protein